MKPNVLTSEDFFVAMIEYYSREGTALSGPVLEALVTFSNAFYDLPELVKGPVPPQTRSPIDVARYSDAYRLHLSRFETPEKALRIYFNAFLEIIIKLAEHLPKDSEWDEETLFSIPLRTLFNDPQQIYDLVDPLFTDESDALALFASIKNRLRKNEKECQEKKIKLETADDAIDYLLKGTPFLPLLKAKVSFTIPDEVRPEHVLVVASTGTGKSQFIQADVFHQLQKVQRPGIVVIDSQGTMLPKIEAMDVWRDDLVVINPEDMTPPALNMFALPERIKTYDRNSQEIIESTTIELFGFLFAALDQTLTGRQSTFFSFVTRLILSIPGATIRTLREVMEEEPKTPHQSNFWPFIKKLDDDAQAFFINHFYQKGHNLETKRGIVQRLYGILRVPAFNRMFTSRSNKLDLFYELNAGRTILVNTSKSLLGNDASSVFGRYIIAQTLSAVFQRVAIQRPYRPALLYIDEAADYFQDETLANLFAQARKFELGALIAFQNLDQLPSGLRQVVITNTSTKLVAGLSNHDARALAPDMRQSAEWLLSMRKTGTNSEFGCYIRNYTPNAVRLSVPFGVVEDAHKMSPDAHQAFLQRNREKYGASEAPSAPETSNEVPRLHPTSVSTTPEPARNPASDPHAGIDD